MNYEDSQLYYIAHILNKEIGQSKYKVKRNRLTFDENNITYCYTIDNIMAIAGIQKGEN